MDSDNSTFVAEIIWPAGWFGLHRWELAERVMTLRHEATGDTLHVAGGVLTDGTNLIGVVSERTQRQSVARCGPATGWGIEENVNLPAYCSRIWAHVVEAMIHGKKSAEAELGGLPE